MGMITRRELLASVGGAAAALAFVPGVTDAASTTERGAGPVPTTSDSPARAGARRGRIKQSVSRWPYREIPLPDFARAAADIGLAAIDLLQPQDWAVVADHGLVCSMGYPTDRRDFIATGFNDPANHSMLLRELEATIPRAAAAGVPNVISMFGNREGRGDRQAIDACVAGLNRIKALAEEEGVTVCLELLNSKVDHPDYHGDRTFFGVEVVSAVGSPRVKLLYDIYHMQIMEGDVIRTIRDNIQHIAHFHTGGVPGRHELDDTQELNYRGIAAAIAETGFDGYVAHEFTPTRDPLTSLREAFTICDV
jgi:hydroxypyruvate isomerase